jgi:hypothetical protein
MGIKFSKFVLKINSLAYTLGFQNVQFKKTDPIQRELKNFFYMNLDEESAQLPFQHLKSIYNRMIDEQPWSTEVKWNPLDRIQIQWPKSFQNKELTLDPVEVTINGKKSTVEAGDIAKVMHEPHKINRLDFQVKPWIRKDMVGGITLRMITMDLSLF